MRRAAAVLLMAMARGTALQAGATPVAACSCAGPWADFWYKTAENIVVAQEDPAPGWSGEFETVQVLKGEMPENFRVKRNHENPYPCLNLWEGRDGARHLLLLFEGDGPVYEVGLCNPSGYLGEPRTDELLAGLQEIAAVPDLPPVDSGSAEGTEGEQEAAPAPQANHDPAWAAPAVVAAVVIAGGAFLVATRRRGA